jgi:hypothetical protein
MARAFAPNLNNFVSIHITTPKMEIECIDNLNKEKKSSINKKQFYSELFDYINYKGVEGVYKKYEELLLDKYGYSLSGLTFIENPKFMENIKDITNSVVTSLQFMGSKIGNYEEKLNINNLVEIEPSIKHNEEVIKRIDKVDEVEKTEKLNKKTEKTISSSTPKIKK